MLPIYIGKNIWIAAGDGDLERVQELLTEGISPNAQDENGYTPLAAAVSYKHYTIIELLISHGADVNIRDFEGDTPLHVAETVEIAELLLDHGADPFITNFEGKTPAQVAFQEDCPEVACLLRSKTGEPEPEPESERTLKNSEDEELNGIDE
ncbi:hypothetical protein G9A89_019102 [Geosiphon pyriformis]|nr:hypothetical protein G9A89_000587 [Geosiphon pyriformis]KAG9293763.1 hypothetical protein G9A89_019100 [Geosiphon pyriformis]KAG9293765.1 hypothetical protein G9A89_019102 [Geosiphon pyriformis]